MRILSINKLVVLAIKSSTAIVLSLIILACSQKLVQEQAIESISAPFKMPQLQRPVFPDQTFNIKEYGAIEGGVEKNTDAFRNAIAACNTAGGGKVIVPAGKWLSGAIHLKSNVNLVLQAGAEIHFSDKPEDYLPVVFTRWAGFEIMNYSPLIYARDCENIAITGPGKLFGHGKAWWHWKKREDGPNGAGMRIYKEMVLKNVPPDQRVFGNPEEGNRPQFINMMRCKNVLLEGFTIAEPGPFWTIHLVYCDKIIARKISINTIGVPNTDGINLDSSSNALIENCVFNTGDNSIALKSGINADGWRVGLPTENVVVRNVLATSGSLAIGSEMSGGVRNVLIEDCEFGGTKQGVRVKTNASRGGFIENIWFRNYKLTDINREAINIITNYSAWMSGEDGKHPPVLRNINIENLQCEGANVAAIIAGTPQQPIEGLTLKNISIKAEKGMQISWVNGLNLIDVKLEIETGEPIELINCKNIEQKE
jgi:polygalacturonase